MSWKRLLGRRAFLELPTAEDREFGISGSRNLGLPNSLLDERMRRERCTKRSPE